MPCIRMKPPAEILHFSAGISNWQLRPNSFCYCSAVCFLEAVHVRETALPPERSEMAVNLLPY
jgi:hypothetical protein